MDDTDTLERGTIAANRVLARLRAARQAGRFPVADPWAAASSASDAARPGPRKRGAHQRNAVLRLIAGHGAEPQDGPP